MFGRIKKLFRGIYEEQYVWLSHYFEELGFTRKRAYAYKDLHITDTFLHKEKGLSLTLTVEFSPRRRTWDVIGVWLMLTGNPSVNKRWSIWRSELVEEKLKEELRFAVEAFSQIEANYADYDNNEPLYWYDRFSKPLLRGEEYYISDYDKWIHAKTLGELYIEAFQKGGRRLSDIRPIKINPRKCAGGILWEDGFGGFVHEWYSLSYSEKLLEEDPLLYARKKLEERVKAENPEIFPEEDVTICLERKIHPYHHRLSCPICGKPSEELLWIDFCSPASTWEKLCGRSGPLSICPECGWQVEFICETMN